MPKVLQAAPRTFLTGCLPRVLNWADSFCGPMMVTSKRGSSSGWGTGAIGLTFSEYFGGVTSIRTKSWIPTSQENWWWRVENAYLHCLVQLLFPSWLSLENPCDDKIQSWQPILIRTAEVPLLEAPAGLNFFCKFDPPSPLSSGSVTGRTSVVFRGTITFSWEPSDCSSICSSSTCFLDFCECFTLSSVVSATLDDDPPIPLSALAVTVVREHPSSSEVSGWMTVLDAAGKSPTSKSSLKRLEGDSKGVARPLAFACFCWRRIPDWFRLQIREGFFFNNEMIEKNYWPGTRSTILTSTLSKKLHTKR